MRRVLMTTDAVGGVFTYAMTLARQFAARGVGVDLAVLGPALRDHQREAALGVPRLALHELDCALEWMDDPWDDVARSAEWLRDLERRVRPDIVHVNGYAHAAAGFRAPVVAVAHSCVLSWWDAVFGVEAPAPYDTYRREAKRGLGAADAVIAPSRAMLDCLQRFHGFSGGVVVPNGAPLPERIRKKEPFVLASGRLWDRAKNVAAVARVAPRVRWPIEVAGSAEGGTARTTLAGSAEGGTARTTLAGSAEGGTARAPLAGSAEGGGVRDLGWLSPAELSLAMERASIFVAPALYEPFGLCALEAALRSCALVLGDIASQREIWGDGALFVDPRDDAALASAIAKLIDDEPLRGFMGERAWRRALAYSPGRMADGTLEVYRRALGRRVEGAVSCAS